MRDLRAESPPREAIITTEKILLRPPSAPQRPRRPLYRPREISPLPANLLAPWSAMDDRDEETPLSRSITPRRLFVHEIPDDTGLSESSSTTSDMESQSDDTSSAFSTFTTNRRNLFSRRGERYQPSRR